MESELIYEHKRIYPNNDINEIKIWKVSKSDDKPHGFKYSLVYIRDRKRVVGYDNGEKKGDHRHYKNKEYAYDFKGIDKLFEDFRKDIRRFKDESKKRKT